MRVMIATPTYGGQCTTVYTASMIDLFKRYGQRQDIELEYMYGLNEALITKARTLIANIFVKSDYTHLLFIDADIQFISDQLFRMIECGKDQDFVCGIYPKKTMNWDSVGNAARNGVPSHALSSFASTEFLFEPVPIRNELVNGLVEIQRAATGMMLLSKKVFHDLDPLVKTFRMEAPVQTNLLGSEENLYKEYFFTSFSEEGVFLHEDFTFCNLWTSTGGKIYGAPWVKLNHAGMHVYG